MQGTVPLCWDGVEETGQLVDEVAGGLHHLGDVEGTALPLPVYRVETCYREEETEQRPVVGLENAVETALLPEASWKEETGYYLEGTGPLREVWQDLAVAVHVVHWRHYQEGLQVD